MSPIARIYSMRKVCRFSLILLLCQTVLTGSQWVEAQDHWPQWRGPHRDGTVQGIRWPDDLQPETLKVGWIVDAGLSYSGPVVDASRVYLTETRNREREVVRALDRRTGEELWSTSWSGALEVPFFAKANGDWIRATPAVDGDRLYVAGMRDYLACLDARTGEVVWSYDFPKQTGSPLPDFGFVSSPLVLGEFVYVQAGGGFCKLNKHNGELLWIVLQDGGGMNGSAFSSPFAAELGGQQTLLVQTRNDLAAVDPATGSVLWKQTIPAFRGMNILTPTIYRDSFFTSSYGGSSWLYKLPAPDGEPVQVWKNKVEGYMSSPVIVGDFAYLHLKNQRFTCIDLRSGESQWTTQPFGKYWSLVTDGSNILALDQQGDLFLARANPEKFELLDRRKVTEAESWAHIAVAGEQVFVRDLQSLRSFQWKPRVRDESRD